MMNAELEAEEIAEATAAKTRLTDRFDPGVAVAVTVVFLFALRILFMIDDAAVESVFLVEDDLDPATIDVEDLDTLVFLLINPLDDDLAVNCFTKLLTALAIYDAPARIADTVDPDFNGDLFVFLLNLGTEARLTSLDTFDFLSADGKRADETLRSDFVLRRVFGIEEADAILFGLALIVFDFPALANTESVL